MVLLFNTRSITFALLVELIVLTIVSMTCMRIFINPGNKV